jgi:hypothetical protein
MTIAAETLTIRRAMPEDAPVCGQICYDAFSAINQAHNFPCDFPGPEVTTGVLSMMFSAPDFTRRRGARPRWEATAWMSDPLCRWAHPVDPGVQAPGLAAF